jgi:hypothetical protein
MLVRTNHPCLGVGCHSHIFQFETDLHSLYIQERTNILNTVYVNVDQIIYIYVLINPDFLTKWQINKKT